MDNFDIDLHKYCHTDVNEDFVSNPYPGINEQIEIRFRTQNSSHIKKVLIRAIIDGTCTFIRMEKYAVKGIFAYYRAHVIITQNYLNYHFVIITNDKVYYHTKSETTLYPPTEDHDYVILADFANPHWIPQAVFYQIFPDRFKCGNPENSVKTGEYEFDGASTKHVAWGTPPLTYQEGHCLDFYGGDLEGIKQAIPHFKELGVTALYLNPIFSAKTNHRYDCTDYFTVDAHLGGDDALVALSEELHKNGIKLILDVSINHTGIAHPWVTRALADPDSEERNFYYYRNGTLRSWAGVPTLPQLNFNSTALRGILYRNKDSFIKKFLRPPFNIDGWRFDVAHNTGRAGLDQYGNEIWQEVRASAKAEKKECYLVAEHWKDNISYMQGDQVDGAMNYFASSRPLRSFAGENDRYMRGMLGKDGTYVTSGGIELQKQIEQHYARIPDQLRFLQFNLLDSHDVHRLHTNSAIFDFALYRGILILLFMLQGTPSIYYGDEVGLGGDIDTIENARYPMEWERSQWKKDFFELYSSLAKIKGTEKALHYGSMRILYADATVFVLARFTMKEVIIGVASKDEEQRVLEIPLTAAGIDGDLKTTELLTNRSIEVLNGILSLDLEPKAALLLKVHMG